MAPNATPKSEVLNLLVPIAGEGGVEITSLSIRRPKVRDFRAAAAAAATDEDKDILLLANLAMITPAQIDELDLADYQAAGKILKGFLSLSE